MNIAKIFGANAKLKLYMQIRVMQLRDGINYPLKTFWTDRETTINPGNVYFFSPGLRDYHKSIVKGSFSAWIDIDKRELPNFYKTPSLIIDTGHGYHVYWMFEDFCPPEELATTIKKLIDFYKSDPKTSDITRFMRYPESYNQKFNPAHFCKIIHQEHNRYDWLDLIPLENITK